jgi:uncharacterized delta-60 repeat protein
MSDFAEPSRYQIPTAGRGTIVTVCAIFLAVQVVLAQVTADRISPQSAGTLDASFGASGKIVSSFSGFVSDAAVQPNGQILVAGFATIATSTTSTAGGYEVARYNSDGSLDQTFGINGVAQAAGLAVFAIALQQDNKILLAGPSTDPVNILTLIRLNPGGQLDSSFGASGVLSDPSAGVVDGSCVVVQPDLKILAGGDTSAGSVLVRYNPDGTRDSSFGSGGITTSASLGVSAMAIQLDGKIVATGPGAGALGGQVSAPFLVIRLNPDGTPDAGFGSNGLVQTAVSRSGDAPFNLALQANGQIVVVGSGGFNSTSPGGFELIRLNQDGSLDTTFGVGGKVTTTTGGAQFGFSVALQQDQRIVVVGSGGGSILEAQGVHPESLAGEILLGALGFTGSTFVVARYNTDGSLDTTFGTGGVVATSFSQPSAIATAVAIQPDDNIIVAGDTGSITSSTITSNYAIARYIAGPLAGDFSVSPGQTSIDIEQGTSAGVTITADPISGSTPPSGPIALTTSVSQAASGLTASLSAPSINIGGSATLNLAAGSTTPLGQYTVTITGTAGTIVRTASLTVTVAASSDFSIAFAQPSITVTPPEKPVVTVSIDRTGGFAGDVTVTAPSSLPKGIVLKGKGQIATSGNSAAFKFKVKPSAALGSDQLTFTGTDSTGRTRSATLTMVIQ